MPSSIPGISQSISHCTPSQHSRSVPRSHSKARRPLHLFALMVVLLASRNPLIAQLVQVNSISTVAGTLGSEGGSGDGGAATSAQLYAPYGVAKDNLGNIYITDQSSSVRKVDASTGTITTVAGIGMGFSGDGGPATSARLGYLYGIAVDGAGNIYVVDNENIRVRKIAAATGIITTIAGTGTSGYTGDGEPATSARLFNPQGVATDAAGNVYIVDLPGEIRMVSAATGIITTVAGTGSEGFAGDGGPATSAKFDQPEGITLDSAGNIYIADYANERIRMISAATRLITTVAGNGNMGYAGDGAAATNAELRGPRAVAVDNSGNLYISDFGNEVIRKVNRATGDITTLAGSGTLGLSGDGGPAISAQLHLPKGLAVDTAGDVYIADTGNSAIRKVSPLAFPDTNVASSAASKNLFLQTTAAATISSFTVPVSQGNKQEYTVGTVTGCAVDGVTSNPAGTICTVPITFSPAYPGLRPVPLQAVTSGGNINIGLNGKGIGPLIAFTPGIVSTFAGNYAVGSSSGNGGPATAATFYAPIGMAVDNAGNIYVAEEFGAEVRKIDASTGIISLYAGGGYQSPGNGDGGPATNALVGPLDLALDSARNLYLTNGSSVRKVDAATGIISLVAGSDANNAIVPPPPQPSNGDGGPATQALFKFVSGIALDPQERNLYLVDNELNQVRKIDLTTGIISTVAGTGTQGYTGDGGPAISATLHAPQGAAVDLAGNVYFTDDQDNVVRRVDAVTGIITTYAGNPNMPIVRGQLLTGPATSINISALYLKFDSGGNLYIGGSDAIRRVDAVTNIMYPIAQPGDYTRAGSALPSGQAIGVGGLGGVPAGGIALDGAGSLYLSEDYYLQKINVGTSEFLFDLTQVDTTDTADGPQPVNVANIGNAALMLAAPATGTNPALSPASYTFDTAASNPCSATIDSGNSCAITLDFEPLVAPTPPASEVTIPGSVVLTDNSLNIPTSTQTIPVTGRSFGEAAGPQPVLTPATMDFGSLTVGTTSAAQTATLSNTGGVPQSISSFGFFGSNASSFRETNNCGPSLAAGASCSIAITCTPSAAGALTASLGANFPSPEPQLSIALTCNGTAAGVPQAALSPASLSFTTVAGTTPAPQVATLTNSGTVALAISQVSIGGATGGAFSQTNTCGTSLAAGASCAITVSFSGTGVGSYPAALQVADNAPNTPQAVTLSGTVTAATAPGAPIATLTPASLSYSATTGTTSGAQMAMLTNSGTATLNIAGITLTGANPSDFAISSNTCGATLAVAATCAISVTFTPASAGSFSASVSVTDNASGSPQTSALSGTGTAPAAAADFTVTATPASQSVVSGSGATYSVSIASTGGIFAQAVALTASGLPPGTAATFSPASVTPGSSGAQATMIVQTAAQQTAKGNGLPRWPFTAPVFAAVLLLFPSKRFRLGQKSRGAFTSLACIIALVGLAASTIGCGAGFALPSSAKTYTITVTGTSGSDTHSTTVTLTVQ